MPGFLSMALCVVYAAALPAPESIFPIGIWYDGRVNGINVPDGCTNVPAGLEDAAVYYRETFRDIRSRGIRLIVIPNTPPDYRETLLREAEKADVKIVLELIETAFAEFGGNYSLRHPEMITDRDALLEYYRAIIEPLKKSPALWGYQLIDEPPAEMVDNWALVAGVLAELDPTRPPFSCLCSEEAVARVKEMGIPMLIFDRYPIGIDTPLGAYDPTSYIGLMEFLHDEADKAEVPWWNVVQSFAIPGNRRWPEALELRQMVYLSLACNAKGIFYFLYNSNTQNEHLEGLVDVSLKPHPLFDTVADLSAELEKLGPLVLRLQPDPEVVMSCPESLYAAGFRDNNRRYAIVVNKSGMHPCEERILVKGGVTEAVCALKGDVWKCTPGKESATSELPILLGPGEGRVVELR